MTLQQLYLVLLIGGTVLTVGDPEPGGPDINR
jgi:hypothetical protein